MALGAAAELDQVPGSPETASDVLGLGGSQDQAQPQASPDVQEQLRNSLEQLRQTSRQVDGIMNTVQGIATAFPIQSDKPAKIGELATQMKKLMTEYVMDVVKQAPGAMGGPKPTPMR